MRVAGAAGVLLAVALAGCAPPGQTRDAVGHDLPATSLATTYPALAPAVACPTLPAQHLASHQAPVEAAYLCGEESRPIAGDGVWSFQVVRRVTDGLNPLLAAYAVPDAGPAAPDTACAAVGWAPLIVYLHDASGVRAVRAPQDDCGGPTSAARTAFESVTTAVVWEKKTRQVQSQQSVDSGCPDQYKDMLSIYEQFPSSARSPAAAPAPLAAPVLECMYRVIVDAEGERVGEFQGYRTLTADQVAAVNAALGHARADPTCSRHEQTRFAVLGMDRSPTTVALDGCAVEQDSGWWRAGDDLRAALAG
jgi:hypothetical protein